MMKKKAACLLGAVLLIFTMTGILAGAATLRTTETVYDDAGLLSESDISALQSEITELRDEVSADFIIYITDKPANDSERTAADSILNEWVSIGGGYGEQHETILLYVDMKNRHFFVAEHTDNQKFLLSDSQIDSITGDDGKLKSYMAEGNYRAACETFLSEAKEAAKPGFLQTVWGWITTALLGSGAATGIAAGVHNSKNKLGKRYYMRETGVEVLESRDSFSYQSVEEHKIERSHDSGASSSDGMSSGNHGGGNSF